MSCNKITEQINKTYCVKTSDKLSDESLHSEFIKSPSTNKKLEIFKKILDENKGKSTEEILKKIAPYIIPPGTKGVIRGIKFNKIVEEYLKDLNLPDNLELKFEEKNKKYPTDEIPDFYIYDKKNKKMMFGMNQIDLWGGGAQSNRASKYILQQKKSNNIKTVCVVCKKAIINNKNTKCYKIFKIGFENKTLCYLKGLKKIINEFFKIKLD